ncbi:transcriptional regulator, LacI family [Cohaesibacter sp. ES.047]|uniref:LacI family DNA-binding transcriptional regulator n=1 Tax=Cohaesibacter sp. ES.047 TaxID=1798205 RepID=UPI000BC05A55|nr:LacI family DNA-binding transcriptional regulator [Cohaesibacter sp. ES.047]SNY91145.1 transcriptional regulator, LacI family [Cohaesibacter sp. ES.047]
MRCTISDVAKALGLSKSTVSRALNGYPDISEATRDKVRQTSEHMGYKPMVQAQAIRTGLVRSLGVIFNSEGSYGYRTYLTELIDGISRRAYDHHWTVTVTTAPDMQGTLEMMERLCEEKVVDGFILPRTKAKDPRVKYLQHAKVPFTMYGRVEDTQGCSWFDIDGERAMHEAVKTLAALGHTRIGFINGLSSYMYARLRLEGYKAGLEEAGLAFNDNIVRSEAVSKTDGLREGRILLKQEPPPSAIICALDLAALGLYEAAEELNLQIGRDLSVISYDGINEGAYARPGLTTYSVDHCTAGADLVDLLVEQLHGSTPETLRKLASAHLIERGSAGPYIAG